THSGSTNGEAEPRIIHFDATERRKQKMRERAQQGQEPAAAPAGGSVDFNPREPSRPNGRPAAAHANGNGHSSTAATAVAPPVAPAPASAPVTLPPAVSPAQSATGSDPFADERFRGSGDAGAAKGSDPLPRDLERFLIEFVVEQTGYPEEMVDLDADLEADLGIDSIKKAQLFAELADQFSISAAAGENLSLDDFPTLRDVKGFLERNSAPAPVAAPAATPASSVALAAPSVSTRPEPAAPPAAVAVSAPVASKEARGPERVSLDSAPDLERFLIEFVVEQTGYPEEMVELDADLEADLGIDSIKKAQLFGELAEHFEISAAAGDDLSLDDFPTLRHVMEFLQTSGAATSASLPAPQMGSDPFADERLRASGHAGAAKGSDPLQSSPDLERFLIEFVVEQTGYPEEMVELDADLEADLGIDSIKKAQLFGELAEHFEISTAGGDDLSLDDFPTLRHVLAFLEGSAAKVAV
ncbi:MAG: hypothetical protein KY476_23305, partial [Planctomycetes bacterium]|nr:hypothetical protein [Planctomycetota bacterium]